MRKIFVILILALFLTTGCLRKDVHPAEPVIGEEPGIGEEVECDALTPCNEGYQCVKLPDKLSPVCVTEETLKSPKYGDCAILESYPIQLKCPEGKIPAITKGCEKDSDCKIGGCNGEICSEEEMSSICLYKPEFECFKLTNCKCINGRCDWEQTEKFLDCRSRY